MIDAAKRSSAKRITAYSYFGYARQDRKSASRTTTTAKLVANLLTQAGADSYIDNGPRRTNLGLDIPR